MSTYESRLHTPSLLALAGILLPGLYVAPAAAARYGEPVLYRPGEVIVQYRSAPAAARAKAGYGAMGMQIERALLGDRTYLIRLPAFTDVDGARRLLVADPDVLHVEPNYLRRTRSALPNDPLFGNQWGLFVTNPPQRNFVCDNDRPDNPCESRDELASIPGADMNLPAAWDANNDGVADRTGSNDVVVAVIDDSFDVEHPDLAANFVPGRNLVNDNDDVRPDSNGLLDHGTLVAGSLGAVGNNNEGVAGVTWNTSLMPLKIGRVRDDAVELSEDAILDAYQYVLDNNAQLNNPQIRIINASYGGPSFSQIEQDKIEELADADVLFVTSAGNFNSNLDYSVFAYPANYDVPNVVAVAATNRQDNVASFSQFGPLSTDVAAPGLQIVTTSVGGGYVTGETCGPDGPCGVNGTSFSSPHVAGIAALIKSAYPDADYRELRARLIEGAEPGVQDGDAGELTAAGRVDAANSLNIAPRPSLILRSVRLIDDDNKRLDPGETLEIEVVVTNLWQPATNVSAELVAPAGVEVLSAAQSLGTLAQDGTATVRFSVQVANEVPTPYQDLAFAVSLSANGGAYSVQRPFRLELAELTADVPVTETLSKGLHDEFHTYHIDVPVEPAANVRLVIRTEVAETDPETGKSKDIDVLVKYGEPARYDIDLGAPAEDDPTFFTDADKVGGGEDGDETIVIDNPRAGTYYVTVLNYSLAESLDYQLEATLESRIGGGGGGGALPFVSSLLLGLLALTRSIRRRHGAALNQMKFRGILRSRQKGLPEPEKAC